ncbi:MAG: hypothetical protein JKX97_02135 [Candidatus Lindowbacteria bacterium]|nr:hypothetical protein [Candidatus Lindowbacteria bacterium]
MNLRPLFILGLILVVVVVIGDGILTPPDQKWEKILEKEANRVDFNKRTLAEGGGQLDEDAISRAAQAHWQLAEFHYSRGKFDSATVVYRDYVKRFPYESLDMGYRTDDANLRLRQIKILTTGSDTQIRKIHDQLGGSDMSAVSDALIRK